MTDLEFYCPKCDAAREPKKKGSRFICATCAGVIEEICTDGNIRPVNSKHGLIEADNACKITVGGYLFSQR